MQGSVGAFKLCCAVIAATDDPAAPAWLQVCWEGVVASAVAAEKQRGGPVAGSEEVEGIVARMQACAAAYTALLSVVKCQTLRVQVRW